MSFSPLEMPSLDKIAKEVGVIFDKSLIFFENDPAWAARTGAYFCLADAETGLALIILAVGTVPPDKAEKYLTNCVEKAGRLAEHPEHLSSWESRDPDKQQWGGAIRGFDPFIYSLSGLPELGDEAVMIALVHKLRMRVGYKIDEIAEKSHNPYSLPLYEFLKRSYYFLDS
ncbi:MAG: hypothetical protein WDN47_01665 [Candidatus Doudnabacteria bacterium]